jgi:hypothetical protein
MHLVIKKGDRVFFADNSKSYLQRCDVFGKTAEALGLVPALHGGVGAAVRQSNQDGEIRDSFYAAQAIVLYFGAPNDGSNHDDHWVLPELKHRITSGADLLIYVSEDFPVNVLQKYGYADRPQVLSGGNDFGTVLRNDLKKLIGERS